MPAFVRFIVTILFVCFLFISVSAQITTVQSSVTITAAAAGERVRITAPSSIVHLHVEIYAAGGMKFFDQELKGGNIFDWHLQDGQAQRLAPDTYVCVVTAKSTSGRLYQKIGRVTINENSVSVQPSDSQQLSVPLAQTIGPLEENSSWTVAGENEPQTATAVAHDGKDGQMIRGRGALTFRLGNLFSGVDQEQMRLTETGSLGIGTAEPKAKLDVAGTIRAERFLVAKPNQAAAEKSPFAGPSTNGASDSAQPLTYGDGTTNQLLKWLDGTTGWVGDSAITESAGNIAIGATPHPTMHFQVRGESPGSQITAYSTAKTATNYGLDAGAVGVGGESNVGGFFTAGGAYANKGIYINGISATEYNYAIFSDAAAQSYFAGNVGIGTKYPKLGLHIKTPSDQQMLLDNDGGEYTSIYFANNGAIKANVYLRNSFNEFRIGGTGLDTATVFTANTDVERMRIAGNGNVGIGTRTPGSPLSVAGTIESTSGGFKFPDGTVQTTAGGSSNAYVQKTGDTMSGTLNLPANGLVAGTNQLVLSNGNVGIGKVPSSNVKLDIQGTLNAGQIVMGTGQSQGAKIEVLGFTGSLTPGLNVDGADFAGFFVGNRNWHNSEGIWAWGNARGVGGSSDYGVGGTFYANSGIGVHAESTSGIIMEGWSGSSANKTYARKFFFANDGTLNLPANGLVAGTNQLVLSAGGVGIGTNAPKTQLHVATGNVYIETQGTGIILKATDGANCFLVTVNNAGTLATASIPCPGTP
jgi:hypothetical protein